MKPIKQIIMRLTKKYYWYEYDGLGERLVNIRHESVLMRILRAIFAFSVLAMFILALA